MTQSQEFHTGACKTQSQLKVLSHYSAIISSVFMANDNDQGLVGGPRDGEGGEDVDPLIQQFSQATIR